MRGGDSFNTAASGRPTLDDQLNVAGLGWYQGRLFAMLSLIVVADGMEMTVLSMLRKPLSREFGLDDYGFAALGSGTRAPRGPARRERARAIAPPACACSPPRVRAHPRAPSGQ